MSQSIYDNWIDYYELFGLSYGEIDSEELREAYFDMSKKNHPDIHSDSDMGYYHDMQCLINEAYRVLSNKKLKKQYDELYEEHNNPLEADKIYIDNVSDFMEYINSFDREKQNIMRDITVLLNRVNNNTLLETEYARIKNNILGNVYRELNMAYQSTDLAKNLQLEEKLPIINEYIDELISILSSIPDDINTAKYKIMYDEEKINFEKLEKETQRYAKEKGTNNSKYCDLKEEIIVKKAKLARLFYMIKNSVDKDTPLKMEECTLKSQIKETKYIFKEMIKECNRISKEEYFKEQKKYLKTYMKIINEYQNKLIELYIKLANVEAEMASSEFLDNVLSANELEQNLNLINSKIIGMEIKCHMYEQLNLLDNADYLALKQDLVIEKGSCAYYEYLLDSKEEVAEATSKAQEIKYQVIRSELREGMENNPNPELVAVYSSLYNLYLEEKSKISR